MCALPMPPASNANANFADNRALPLSTAPKDRRAQPKLRAASHCVQPSAAKSSRSTSPGCAGSAIDTLSSSVAAIDVPESVVIDKVDVNRLARIEAERDAPIPGSPRRPTPRWSPRKGCSRKPGLSARSVGRRACCNADRMRRSRGAKFGGTPACEPVSASCRNPLVFDFHSAWPIQARHRAACSVRVPYTIRKSHSPASRRGNMHHQRGVRESLGDGAVVDWVRLADRGACWLAGGGGGGVLCIAAESGVDCTSARPCWRTTWRTPSR